MRRNAWRSVATVVIGALLTLAPVLAPSVATPAAAYPATVCATLQVSTMTPRVGEAITVTGVNFLPDTAVDLKLEPLASNTTASDRVYDLKTVTSDAAGKFTTTVVMPAATTSQGNFNIIATSGAPQDNACPADPRVDISLRAAGAAGNNNPDNTNANGTPGATAFTGVNVLILVLIAAGLIAVGTVITRRGRSSTATR